MTKEYSVKRVPPAKKSKLGPASDRPVMSPAAGLILRGSSLAAPLSRESKHMMRNTLQFFFSPVSELRAAASCFVCVVVERRRPESTPRRMG